VRAPGEDGAPVLAFREADESDSRLEGHHADGAGVWLKLLWLVRAAVSDQPPDGRDRLKSHRHP
jgi:hypothetical protein